MRMFVAADLTDEQRNELRAKVEEAKLAAPFDYIRWIPEENWHATLAFIGDRAEEDFDQVVGQIDKVMATSEELAGRPSRIQGFPHRDRPRLLALKLEPAVGIQKLHWNLTQALGIRADRNFRLHVTIARFRDLGKEDAHTLNHAIKDLSAIDRGPWHFQAVTLYESVLKQSGAEYKVVRTWPE
ncbi:MAG: RNA 2',3'-cyclic phosphodiesterase [Chlorobia bacterium]|nr:RNA 2',3'-cyclic phosphodiesterase [Fimbriimonadaceae bacterium]